MKTLGAFCASLCFIAATSASYAQVKYDLLPSAVFQQRLSQYGGNDEQREATLKTLFEAAGCSGDKLTEQPIGKKKDPNLICVLPGASDERIVVGAHYDHVDRGSGVVDNWSSAALLPTLYQGLKGSPRKHTFVFIAFAYEEAGLVGSEFYASHLSKEERSKIVAMVNMDTLGLGPTEVWTSHADQPLIGLLVYVAKQMNLPLTGMNVDRVGNTDSESFARYKIRRMTIHTITNGTWHILHSSDDNMKAIKLPDYLDSYHLIEAYLATLDPFLGSAADTSSSHKQ